jgi:hypothetical protein
MFDIIEEEIFISEEEKQELIIKFTQHVFEEVQTEGWKTRRNELQVQCGYWGVQDDFTDDMTFDKIMERNNYNLDEVISKFLCKVIGNLGTIWFKAWLSQLRPDLDIIQRPMFWEYWAWNSLNKFLYIEKRRDIEIVNYELVKEVLGLNFDLK